MSKCSDLWFTKFTVNESAHKTNVSIDLRKRLLLFYLVELLILAAAEII